MDKRYLTIFVIMVTEVLGFSLILPFLPFYAQEYGASPLMVGIIFTVFSFFQFFSAPIMGKLSDHYGRKPMLIFSQISTFISFLILGFANSLWMIILSRIVDGLLGSNFTIAQAYLSDISEKKNRSKVLGLSGAAFGVGFLIGPGLGGFLSQFGYSVPAFLAAGASFTTILTTYMVLPETIKAKKGFKLDWSVFGFGQFKKYIQHSVISRYLLLFFMYVLTHSIYVSSFALYAERQLSFTAVHIGYTLTFVGVVSIIMRGFMLGRLIDYFGEKKLQYAGTIIVMMAMFLLLSDKIWVFLLAMAFFSIGTGLSRPILVGAISKKVSSKEQGAIMGVTSSIVSISQIIGPLIGGFVINYFFAGSLGIVAGTMMSIGLLVLLTIKA